VKQREVLQPLLQLSVVEEEGREIPSAERPLEQQIALRQMSSLLHEAVDKLSEEYRSVYLWRDLEDVPAKQVAKRLRISVAALKSRLHRARESVGNALDVALIQQPGAKKLAHKRAGASPSHGSEARKRDE
jgi:RNA polymerase sigma-70 factor (ECF subfamily)